MIKAILTDIEGTTSSLSFVKDILFPYARERMADFVRDHAHDAAVRKLLNDVKQIVERDLSDHQVIEQLIRWIDEDKKITPLKALQGMIWEDGYQRGAFKGHVYEDAVRNLKAWHGQGIRLCVYSSGSVHAQKLLFAHTEYGDLTPLFSGYFDTTTGGKREANAYLTIAEAMNTDPSEILFLSDIKEELDAAHTAGMQTVWLVREGALDTTAEHRQVADFDSLLTADK
ncbi:MAG: acireductone synthase [Gammaproteobacteria bacterium]